MTDFIRMTHPDIEGSETFVPDDEAALANHEARGWKKTPKPKDEQLPVVPKAPGAPPEDEWVDLWHHETGGVQRVPNDPAALAEAFDKGWSDKQPKQAKAKTKAPDTPPPGDAKKPSSTDNPKE